MAELVDALEAHQSDEKSAKSSQEEVRKKADAKELSNYPLKNAPPTSTQEDLSALQLSPDHPSPAHDRTIEGISSITNSNDITGDSNSNQLTILC